MPRLGKKLLLLYLDPDTGERNLDPDSSPKCLSEQYYAVVSQPRPEWVIPCMEEFFKVDRPVTTGPILTDMDFCEYDMELACSELSSSSSPGLEGVPSIFLKRCKTSFPHSWCYFTRPNAASNQPCA